MQFANISSQIYLCIWTTTPWTLPANMAICVQPDEEYAVVETKLGSSKDHSVLVCMVKRLPELVSVLNETYRVLSTIPGLAISFFF